MSILSVKNLEKKFGDLTVLKNISFNINDGEIISIIGSSGSGKSTLLRCMNQLETITSGTITIDGKTLVETKNGAPVYAGKDILKEILMETGFVFQNFNLFPHYSVLRNVMEAPVCVAGVPKKQAEEKARELLKKLGLETKADAYPCELSGGQSQRVSIARALALEPKILFFDEPTSALDPISTSKIEELAVELKKKYEGIVYKRRERMILSEAVPYLAGKSEPGFDSQILHEITWFRNYYRGLAPAMYIAYDRIACFGTEDRNFRVTFDTNIRWRTDNLCLDGPTEGTRLLEPGWYLMEVKTPGAVPLWFSKILDDLAIYPASFSKYGFAYQIENQKASEEKAFIPFTDIRQTVSKTAFC